MLLFLFFMKRKRMLGASSLPVVLGFGVSEPELPAEPLPVAQRQRAAAQEKRAVELRDFFP